METKALTGFNRLPSLKNPIGRRDVLRWAAAASGGWLAASAHIASSREQESAPRRNEELMDEIERRACLFFYEHSNDNTGLMRDRARMEGREVRTVASSAATGFALSAMAIADGRRYIDHLACVKRVERTLNFLLRKAPHEHGFYYHFMDANDGSRAWGCEISSIDTAWLLCGVLHCRSHFRNRSGIRMMANEILERVDWKWMLNGTDILSHGWTPEGGFLPYWWDSYAEHLAMYLLAIGSNGTRIPAKCWDAWARPRDTYEGLTFIGARVPLFVHQYSHAWFDFRDRQDQYTNYFDNSRLATTAHRLFCLSLAGQYPWYNENMWGVTASDSRHGYIAWGAITPPSPVDGTLVPCASGGSIVFLPGQCGAVLQSMMDKYGGKAWGRYGFVDAFHPHEDWYSPDVIGIDQGIMLMMAENLRSGSVWDAVMATTEARRAMAAVGLKGREKA